MSDHIPIDEAKGIAERYGVSQVFIFARRPGSGGVEHLVTYGTDIEHSASAAAIGEFLSKKIMGWPEGDDAEVGPRVAQARQAPELKRQRDLLLEVVKGVRDAFHPGCLCEQTTLESFGCHSEECKAVAAAIAECGEGGDA